MKTAAILLAAILASSPAFAQDKLRIATEGAYPPFNETRADGKLVGFDVEIAEALCASMKRECDIVAQDWDGIIPGLVAEKYDLIVASMSITPERSETIDFSDPYYRNFLTIIAAKVADIDPAKLEGLALGAQRATVPAQWAEDTLGRRADIRLYDTITAATADLGAGRIDAIVSDYLPADAWVKDNPGFEHKGDRIDIGDAIGVGIRKGDDELRDAVNEAIKAIRADGTYQKISNSYFDTDIF
jgi:polar amino acid transport system substrate-binding protein